MSVIWEDGKIVKDNTIPCFQCGLVHREKRVFHGDYWIVPAPSKDEPLHAVLCKDCAIDITNPKWFACDCKGLRLEVKKK